MSELSPKAEVGAGQRGVEADREGSPARSACAIVAAQRERRRELRAKLITVFVGAFIAAASWAPLWIVEAYDR
jgi:hypothetical protein